MDYIYEHLKQGVLFCSTDLSRAGVPLRVVIPPESCPLPMNTDCFLSTLLFKRMKTATHIRGSCGLAVFTDSVSVSVMIATDGDAVRT